LATTCLFDWIFWLKAEEEARSGETVRGLQRKLSGIFEFLADDCRKASGVLRGIGTEAGEG
jgi:hypothetical protein